MTDGAGEGRVVVVTGANRGLGLEVARQCVARGDSVVLGSRDLAAGRRAAADLGDGVLPVALDVTDPDVLAAAAADVDRAFGRVDVLVNNAGIANAAPIEHFTLAKWNAVIAVNLTGVFLGCRAVVPHMKARGSGSIINISSVEGMRGSPGLHGYTASIALFCK